MAAGRAVVGVFRAADWWQFKLTPPLALFCAYLVASGETLLPHWREMAALVAAVAICAAYVSLINDFFDREEDARSAKPNRVAALPPALVRALMLLLPAAGAAVALNWRGEPLLLILYAASWIAFTAYSAPPLRLKTRGLPGVVADASGSTLFPALLAVVLAGRAAGAGPDPLWVAAAAAWAAGCGLRGILWHQIADAASDREGSVRTFVQRRGIGTATLVVRLIALPLELAGLALLLILTGSVVPLLLLLAYFGVVAGRSRLWRSQARPTLLFSEYYDALLPVAMIAVSALRHPQDWLLLIPYLILFGRRPAHLLHHAVKLCWDAANVSAYLLVSGARRRFGARRPPAAPRVRG